MPRPLMHRARLQASALSHRQPARPARVVAWSWDGLTPVVDAPLPSEKMPAGGAAIITVGERPTLIVRPRMIRHDDDGHHDHDGACPRASLSAGAPPSPSSSSSPPHWAAEGFPALNSLHV